MRDVKTYFRNESGQVAVIFALAALPLLALTSAAVDFSQVTKERTKISSALDAAVLAAANNNAISIPEKGNYAEAHFFANYGGDITLEITPSVTTSRVRLVAAGELRLDFGNLVGIDNPKLTETSAATLAVDNTICVLALSEVDDASISFDRDMEFLASGCAVHSNSKSTTAIYAEDSLFLPTASSFCAVGGVTGQVEPHSKGECSSVADPYETVESAPLSDCKRESFMISENPPVPGTSPLSDLLNGASEIVLPDTNPLVYDDLLAELTLRHDKKNFGTDKGPKHEQRAAIEPILSMSGDDLRGLMAAFDVYGDKLDCEKNPIAECYGYNNPFLNVAQNETPRSDVVADIFDISFGEFIPEPLDVPDIVTTGVVEIINGQLYSRNNVDNDLVPVSENLTGGDIQLTPGTYCGGLTVDGLRVRFSPGDYIFKDGPLTFLNKSQANADRVTFGFRGKGATLNIESGSNLTIRAAAKGPRKGLAFMQAVDVDIPGNRLPTEGTNRISSGGSVAMSGTAYFPEQTLLISGEDTHIGANSPAVGLIANKIKFRGDRGSRVAIAADHQKAGIPPIKPQVDDGVRLVE